MLGYKKFLINPLDMSSRSSISSSEAIADVQYLVEALKKAYPGKWSMNEDHWNQVIKDLSSLDFEETLLVSKLGDLVADILWRIPDGHLKVRHKETTCGIHYKNHLRPSTTGKNLANIESKEFWKLEVRPSSKGKLAILAISGFPQSSEPSWNGFEEATEQILKSQSLIVDLRGNAGGDDTKAFELVSALLGYELDTNWVRQVFCETAEAYALQINTYERIIWNNYRVKNEEPPKELLNYLEELKEKALSLSRAPRVDQKLIMEPGNPITSEDKVPKFNSDIFVLVDSHTVSSGEWATLFFKKHPRTKVVGQNTYGMIHFGNTGYLRLPNSGLAVSLCMKINEITNGSFYEKTGIAPDIQVFAEDSLEYVLVHYLS